jgi:hypothetical protein
MRGRASAPLECLVVPIILRIYAEILKHEKELLELATDHPPQRCNYRITGENSLESGDRRSAIYRVLRYSERALRRSANLLCP